MSDINNLMETATRGLIKARLEAMESVRHIIPIPENPVTFDEFRNAYLSALVAETFSVLLTSEWGEVPALQPDPRIVETGLRDLSEKLTQVADGLDPNHSYNINLLRHEK